MTVRAVLMVLVSVSPLSPPPVSPLSPPPAISSNYTTQHSTLSQHSCSTIALFPGVHILPHITPFAFQTGSAPVSTRYNQVSHSPILHWRLKVREVHTNTQPDRESELPQC